jgi:hypothetical protein
MKTIKIIGMCVYALAILYSCQSNQDSGKKASDIIGAFKYTGNLEGIALYNEDHFTFTFRNKIDKPDSLLTYEEKYNSLYSCAGTWKLKDSIVTCTFTFDKDPKVIGTSLRFLYDIKGDLFNYRVIDEEGKVVSNGSAIKIQ